MKNLLYVTAFAIVSVFAITGQANAGTAKAEECVRYANPNLMTHAYVSMAERGPNPNDLPYPIAKAYRE